MIEYFIGLVCVVVALALYKFWQTHNIYQYTAKYDVVVDAILSFVYRASTDAAKVSEYEEKALATNTDPRMLFVIDMTQQFAKRIGFKVNVEWVVSTVERILAESKEAKP